MEKKVEWGILGAQGPWKQRTSTTRTMDFRIAQRTAGGEALEYTVMENEPQAKREDKKPDYVQLPLEGLQRIARVFEEGERKYGRHNWKTGGREYRRDAANHAIEHLLRYVAAVHNEERLAQPVGEEEDDLAKVGWWVLAECWHQAKERG